MMRGDSKLVRSLRRRVRAERRRLPKHRRGSAPRGRQYSWRALRGALPVAAFFLPLTGFTDAQLLAILALHTTLATLRRVSELASVLRDPNELWVPCSLPIEDGKIFSAHLRPWWSSALVLAADWVAFAVGMAYFREAGIWAALALPIAGAQATTAAAISVWVARREPHQGWAFATMALHAAAFLAWVFGGKIAALGRWLAEDATQILLHATPAGWFGLLASATMWSPAAATLTGAALLGAGAALTLWTRRALREWKLRYDPWSVVEAAVFASPPTPEGEEPGAEESLVGYDSTANAAAKAGVTTEASAEPAALRATLRAAWRSDPAEDYAALGPVERLAATAFTAKQRRQLALYGPPASATHRTMVRAGGVAALAVLLSAVMDSRNIGVGGAVLAFVWVLPFWSGRWGALWMVQQGMSTSPAHAFLPVSLWSLAGAFLTVGLTRIFVATLLLGAALVAVLGGEAGPHYAALGGVVAAAALPLGLIIALSDCTNDTTARPWRSLFVLPAFLFWLILEVSLTATMFMATDARVVAVCAGALLAINFGVLALYLWAAGRTWFDFVRHAR